MATYLVVAVEDLFDTPVTASLVVPEGQTGAGLVAVVHKMSDDQVRRASPRAARPSPG